MSAIPGIARVAHQGGSAPREAALWVKGGNLLTFRRGPHLDPKADLARTGSRNTGTSGFDPTQTKNDPKRVPAPFAANDHIIAVGDTPRLMKALALPRI
jgi:hypothetical protein